MLPRVDVMSGQPKLHPEDINIQLRKCTIPDIKGKCLYGFVILKETGNIAIEKI
jgi:hypothetical protein